MKPGYEGCKGRVQRLGTNVVKAGHKGRHKGAKVGNKGCEGRVQMTLRVQRQGVKGIKAGCEWDEGRVERT